MQVVLEKEYPVSAPVEAAWEVLSRVELLATCMPGASISEKIDERHFKGQVKVKVGPASANFGGDITLKSLDASQRQIQMMGKGADKGGSSASMDLTASVVAVDQATSKLVGRAEVTVTGKFAQFGGRMMNSVSDMILAQFAQNFSNRAQLQSLSGKPQARPRADGSRGRCGANLRPNHRLIGHFNRPLLSRSTVCCSVHFRSHSPFGRCVRKRIHLPRLEGRASRWIRARRAPCLPRSTACPQQRRARRPCPRCRHSAGERTQRARTPLGPDPALLRRSFRWQVGCDAPFGRNWSRFDPISVR